VGCELGLAGEVLLSNTLKLSPANCSGGYMGWVMKSPTAMSRDTFH